MNDPPNKGRGECRVPIAPAASCAKCRKHTSVVTTVAPGSPGIPARDGFNSLFRALPGDRACLPPSLADLSSANLTPASGRQDHTTSPFARPALSSAAPLASIASPPYVRDDRETPLCVGRDASDVEVIWVKREREYFCEQDWTGSIRLIRFNKSPRARRPPHHRNSNCLLRWSPICTSMATHSGKPGLALVA
jgi:hypothetical protein